MAELRRAVKKYSWVDICLSWVSVTAPTLKPYPHLSFLTANAVSCQCDQWCKSIPSTPLLQVVYNQISLISFSIICELLTFFFFLLWAPYCRHNWSLCSHSEASTAALWGSPGKCESPAVQSEVIADSFTFFLQFYTPVIWTVSENPLPKFNGVILLKWLWTSLLSPGLHFRATLSHL